MSYKVSARKYRPQTFEEVQSQEHIIKTLRNSITSGKISHAYLFSGMRGVGKTTLARLLAKGLNCKNGPTITPCNECTSCMDISKGGSVDVVEIDGASNTGVDDAREIIERVQYRPFEGKYKIFIIDEVHMLSNSAFNALLKTLEEPPGHCIFIFATTESHKIPATILSRCQHFVFKRIPLSGIVSKLGEVCREEGISITEKGLYYIARLSDGSLRDALGMLDQAASFGGGSITDADIVDTFGVVDLNEIYEIGEDILNADAASAILKLSNIYREGADSKRLAEMFAEFFRNIYVMKICKDGSELINLSQEDIKKLKDIADKYDAVFMQRLFNLFLNTAGTIRTSFNAQYFMELAVIKGSSYKNIIPFEEIKDMADKLSVSVKNLPKDKNMPVQSELPLKEKIEEVKENKIFKEIKKENAAAAPEPEVEDDYQIGMPNNPGAIDLSVIVTDMERKKPKIAGALQQAEIIECTASKVILGANNAFIIDILSEAANLEIIKDNIFRRYGMRPSISITSLNDKAGTKSVKVSDKIEAKEAAELEERNNKLKKNPLVKNVLEIFEGSKIE